MKNFIYTFTLTLLVICSTNTFAKSNYNVSTLYLKVFNGEAFTITLDNSIFKSNQLHVLEGIQPKQYLLKVTQDFADEEINERTKGYEKLLYYGHIYIAPKTVIFAYIDKKGKFKVYSQRPTITVFNNNECSEKTKASHAKKSKYKKKKKAHYHKDLFLSTKKFYCNTLDEKIIYS